MNVRSALFTLVLPFVCVTSTHAAYELTNGSFESYGTGNPAAYPYPKVTGWTNVGTPLVDNLAGAISETLPTIPDTPAGNNWLLLDERMLGQSLYQAVGTISLGDQLTLSALIGRPTNTALSDFEVALYRSNGGGGTPDQFLTRIGKSDVAGLGLGDTTEMSKNYTATAADAGQTLFVRLGMLTGDNAGSALQAVVDNVTVSAVPAPGVASASGNLSLVFDQASGEICGITLGGSDGGPAFQRAALGRSIFAGTTTGNLDMEETGDGLRFVRTIRNSQGREATVTESYSPGSEPDSIAWDLVIEGAGDPWTASIQTYLQIAPVGGDLRFWSAGTRSDLPLFNGYSDPLAPMPFSEIHLALGGGSSPTSSTGGISVPIASWLNEGADRALSLVQSPFDFIQDMQLHSNAGGAVNFERTRLRIGGGNTIRLHMQLVAHPSDWRAGLGFMTRAWPAAFDPPNPEAHLVGGGGTYADYRGEPLDAQRFRAMGFTMNWSARFPWPYIGMSLPPVATDDEQWMSIGGTEASGHVIVPSPESVNSMNGYAEVLRQQGFHQLEYFTVTEAGNFIAASAPPRQAEDDADLWKDANDFIYYQIPNANLGISSWLGCRLVDPGDPAWQSEILRQITGISNKLPSCSGICIDRLDHLARFNPAADDGVTWTGAPARSLIHSWHKVMEKLVPIATSRNKVVFANSHIMRRVDVLRHLDGFYSEFRHSGIHNLLALAGARKPVVIWGSPTNDASFQESLYLGIFPSVPFPKANHNTTPNAAIEEWFLDYGPLFNAMRGKKWVLIPHVIEVASGNALANLFEVKSGFVMPVMFGGSATTATVELGPLPIAQLHSVEVLHPGVASATPITPTQQGGRIVLEVPLVRGCAMVRMEADKTTGAVSSSTPELSLHLTPDSWHLEWQAGERLTYFVQQSHNLEDWAYLPVIKSGADSLLTFGGEVDPAARSGFFRLAVVDGSTLDPYLDDFDDDGIGNWAEITSRGDPLRAE